MSEVSGSGDLQSRGLEPVPASLLAGHPTNDAVEPVSSGYDQANSVLPGLPAGAEDFPDAPLVPVPTLPPALPGVSVASSEDIKGLLSKVLVIRDGLEHKPASVGDMGPLVLQRVIDNMVSVNRGSGEASANGVTVVQSNSADLYGMPEHERLSLLSRRLGIDLGPLIRTRDEFLEGILVTQRGILLSIEAMANAEFLEILKERLREEQSKEDQVREAHHKETVDKLKQAIAALKAGEPKVAAEVLNSASLITTAIEQMVDRYKTPGSLRQHLQSQLTLVLDSVTRQGSYQDMMNKRVELLQSAKKV